MITHLGITQPVDQPEAQRFSSAGGASIFQLPLEAYSGFWVYAYLVLVDDLCVLVDTGSGFGVCNQNLDSGFEAVSALLGRKITLADLSHVLITHGHIDHFGGLPHVRSHSQAKIGVHELDLGSLVRPDERIFSVTRRLDTFLREAGVPDEQRRDIVEMYRFIKLDYVSVPVDFTYEAVGMQVGPFEMLHVPGHCAGQVVIRLHDVLFCGDQVLSEISPHQSPEQLASFTGLGHYLQSLATLQNWAGDVRLTLGGHNAPILDLPTRIEEIRRLHDRRLTKILEILAEPQTIAQVSKLLFPDVHGYNVLLALEEAGAHVEYLSQRGLLGIANLLELANGRGNFPILYQALEPVNVPQATF